MSYKNSVKLLTSNFNVVWKELVYMLVTIALTAAIVYGTSQPIIATLKKAGIFEQVSKIFQNIYTSPKDVVSSVNQTFAAFIDTIRSNFSHLWLSIISTSLVVLVLFQFLKSISAYNVSSVMYLKTTSFTTVGYTGNLVSTLGQSTRFALASIVYKIPFFALKVLVLVLYVRLATSPLAIIIGLFLLSIIMILLMAVEMTLFTGFAPYMLEHGGSAFKCFIKGSLPTFKNFLRVFSNSIVMVVTLIVANVFLGLFTLGAALFITIPASLVLVSIFNLCSYFGCKGERYYLSENVICTPKTNENQKIEK